LDGVGKVLNNTDKTLAKLSTAIESANNLLDSDESRDMSQSLSASVNSLNGTLENLDDLIRKLSIRPSSLLFSAEPELDPIPEASDQ